MEARIPNMKWKKIISKSISLLTVICCLAGTATTALAADTGTEEGTEGSGVSRVVVVNEKERIPCLYISKKVDGQAPEGDTFTFKLEVKRSESDPYEEMDSAAVYQLYNVEEDPQHENPIKNAFGSINHKIGDFGTFTLKAGQEARFTLGNGWSYRITEEEKTGYQQKTKTRTGVMDDSARSVEFVNVYQGGSQSAAGLRVEKSVQALEDWTAAASPEFLFLLEVKTGSEYEPAGHEPYALERKAGQRTETVTGLETDAYGKFSLSAEEAAVFSELPANGVYRVRELTLEYVEGLLEDSSDRSGIRKLFGEEAAADAEIESLKEEIASWKEQWPDWKTWWQKDGGLEVREGSTMLAKTELFENCNVSFGVSKRLDDGTRPEESFTFQLSDGSKMLEGVNYYIYRTDTGTQIKEAVTGADGTEAEQPIVHQTREEGKFELKAGQTAVFTGMKPEAGYVVSELNTNSAYKVKTPETGSYSRNVENVPERLVFTNEKVPSGLVVSKSVASQSGEVPGEDTFTFILTRKVSKEGSTDTGYEPVAGEPYQVGKNSDVTGEDGSFTLMDKQSAVFAFLSPGSIYRVEEVIDEETMENAADYQFQKLEMDLDGKALNPDGSLKEPKKADAAEPGQEAVGEAELAAKKRLAFRFTNAYTPRKADIVIQKVDGDGNPLTGAEFKLHRSADLRSPVITQITGADGTVTEQDTYTVDGDGRLCIPDLKAGTYWLEEVRPPSGYRLLPRAVQLEIARKAGKLEIKVKGVPFELADPTDSTNIGSPELPGETDTDQEEVTHIAVSASGEPQKVTVTFTVCNDELYDLPHTGGIGIAWYMIGGVLLMMAAALILYKNNLLGGGSRASGN